MKKLFTLFLVVAVSFSLVACGDKTDDNVYEFTFAHFDSGENAIEMENMVKEFEALHPNVKINVVAKPGEYDTWIQAQFEAGTLPDIGMLNETLTFNWGNEGHIVDLSEHFDTHPDLGNRIESTYYEWAEGKIAGTNTGGETILMFYNRDHFKAVGCDETAKLREENGVLVGWNWDEFNECMVKLNNEYGTVENYRPAQIAAWWVYWHPMVLSNGGSFFNTAGTETYFDSPEVVEAYENVHKFIYTDKLGHDSSTSEALQMGKDQMLIQGKTSVFVSGYWSHPGLANTIAELKEEDPNYEFNLGVTALPAMNDEGHVETVMLGAPTVIFEKEGRTEEELQLLLDFYEFHNSPEQVNMFSNGLWMPLEEKYYTDETWTNKWLTEGVHDLENKLVYTKLTQISTPSYIYKVKGFKDAERLAINVHLSEIFSNFPNATGADATVAKQLEYAKQVADDVMIGTWVNPK